MKTAYYFFGEYLEAGEKIHAVVHRHIGTLAPQFIRFLIAGVFLPIVGIFLFPQLFWFGILWVIIGILYVIYHLYDWYYYVWMITDRAVVSVQSPGLFDVSTTRIEYHMVEGVSYTISGFWRTVLNFGDITLEKVGSGAALILSGGTNPKRVERLILKYQEEFMEHHNYSSHEALKSLLSSMLYEHVKKAGPSHGSSHGSK